MGMVYYCTSPSRLAGGRVSRGYMHFCIVLVTKFITYGIEIVPFKRKIDRKTRKASALENFGMYLCKYQRMLIYVY